MKNMFKLFVMSALAALVGLSTLSCEGPVGADGASGINSYLVTFNYNDGKTLPLATGVNHGGTVTVPTPTWAGFSFDGWYTDGSFHNVWASAASVTQSTTLYAKWFPDALKGTWKTPPDTYPETYIISGTNYTGSGYTGTIDNIRLTDTNAGYITIRFTEFEGFPTHADIGRYYVVHFENLTETSVDISGAYLASDSDFNWPDRMGGKLTQQAAEDTYTVAAGAFSSYSSTQKQ